MKIKIVETISEFKSDLTGSMIGKYKIKTDNREWFVTRHGDNVLLLVSYLEGFRLDVATPKFRDAVIRELDKEAQND